MADRIKQFTLTLSLDKPEQKAAWEALQRVPRGSRTEYICKRLTERERAKELAAIVYENAMKALAEYGGTITKNDIGQTNQAGDVDADILGFLSALQDEGSDDD